MLGRHADARAALIRHDTGKPWPVKGWRYLGEGCSRTAYLSPEKVVYKVGEAYVNSIEAEQAKRLRRSKRLAAINVHVPRTHLYTVGREKVLAMEFIPSHGKADCSSLSPWRGIGCDCKPTKKRKCWSLVFDDIHKFNVNDLWEGNVRYTRDGRVWLIDLGE